MNYTDKIGNKLNELLEKNYDAVAGYKLSILKKSGSLNIGQMQVYLRDTYSQLE